MILLLFGASHTGKTALAQRILEKYHYPYCSIDHLKMGLVRSGYTRLTPEDDAELQELLWPILREMVKTAVENRQNLVIEGAYIPFDWQKDFGEAYLPHIRGLCLVMSERYIRGHFEEIRCYANVMEQRLEDSGFTLEVALAENRENLAQCRRHGCPYFLIDGEYPGMETILGDLLREA